MGPGPVGLATPPLAPAYAGRTVTETIRLVETPPRTFSPALRARMKIVTSAPLWNGRARPGTKVIVAQPSRAVTVSAALDTRLAGTPTAKTSAPRTTLPFESATRARSWIGALREVIRLGMNATLSMIRRFGSDTLVIGIDVVPSGSLIAPVPAAAVTAVGAVVAVDEPTGFFPVTVARRRWPTSFVVAL